MSLYIYVICIYSYLYNNAHIIIFMKSIFKDVLRMTWLCLMRLKQEFVYKEIES
jgi:hypothetical protein